MASAPAAVLEDPHAAPTTGYAAPLMPGGFGGLFTLPPTRPCANVAYQVGKQLSMSDHVKISSAFDAFVADSSPNEECDALVIFEPRVDGSLPWRSKNPSDRTHVTARAERERTQRRDAAGLTAPMNCQPVHEVSAETYRAALRRKNK